MQRSLHFSVTAFANDRRLQLSTATMTDLDDLFSRLKAQNTSSESAQPQPSASLWAQPPPQPGYQPPSVSSPLFSPPIQTPNPAHASNVISPASRMSPFAAPDASQAQEQNRTNNLLNLLKFNGQPSGPMANLQNVQPAEQTQRAASATQPRSGPTPDLMGLLQRQPSAQTAVPPPSGEKYESTANKASTQDFLLNLLTKPNKPASSAASRTASNAAAQNKPDEVVVDQLAQSLADTAIKPIEQPKREFNPARPFGSPSPEPTRFEAPQPSKAGLFNYVNPFDQLSSSSPLNRTPAPQDKKIEILKHDRGPSDTINGESDAPAAKTRKLSPEKEPAKPEPDTHAALKSPQSVSKKLEEVSETVQNEVEEALAAATSNGQSGDAPKATETIVPTIEKKAGDSTVDSDWSTAEDEDAKQEEDAKVEVFNFPMKPFVTLHFTGNRTPRQFINRSWDDHTPIARMKKDFSHDDRALATASQTHIVYAVAPNEKKPATGLKVIRQDDGNNKHLWAKAGERLCNIQVSSQSNSDEEAILATGVNGTIFYTTLSKSAGESFDDVDAEARGFVMSPPPNSDEASSASAFGTSSAIKTRVKLSNRHSSQYFAVARGRQIHLIAPEIVKERGYTDSKTYQVDTERYLAEHSFSINTAKAGKDFCFSEDDTVLVSLDKVGKVKFWDIKELTAAMGNGAKSPRNELKDPFWTLAAGANPLNPDDKMSPSSIMFLDKDRACVKGIALRYLLVGFQQNHIIQLWDLGLGKCVQELRFPESAGSSNAMCSVTYHPKSSIICISHPGRNSVYFIHLSAPRYSMEPMSQATYVSRLARQDKSLPRPESTAIMSGMREYSLSKTAGELRSLDMLKTPFPSGDAPEDQAQFELYIMHSKGVIGLPIKKCDLGWDAKGKMVKPVEALAAGLIKVGDLHQPRAAATEPATATEQNTPAKQTPKNAKKDRETVKPEPKVQVKKEVASPSPARTPAPAPPVSNGTTAPTPAEASMQVPEAPATTNPSIITPSSYSMAAQDGKTAARHQNGEQPTQAQKDVPVVEKSVPSNQLAVSQPAGELASVDSTVQDLVAKEFGSLYQKLDQDKRVADAAGAARQDAMLRLISSTLTENVESSLDRIVSTSIESKVLPSLTSNTSKVIERKLSESLNKQVGDSVSKEVKSAIPTAVSAALRDGQVTRALSTHIIDEVTKQVKMDMGGLVQRSMQTVQTNMASQMTQSTQTVHKSVTDLEARIDAQLREAAQQQKQSNDMLAQLTASMRDLTTTVQSMKEDHAQLLRKSAAPAPQQAAPTQNNKDAAQPEEDPEVARLTQMLKAGDYQQATIDWLQSTRQAELFDNLFMYLNPLYLQQVSSLVALSVSAAITSSFDRNVDKRLEWLGTIITNIDQNVRRHHPQSHPEHLLTYFEQDPDIRDVAPKIMDVLYQRLQGAYMMLAESPQREEQALRKTASLTRQIGELRRVLG